MFKSRKKKLFRTISVFVINCIKNYSSLQLQFVLVSTTQKLPSVPALLHAGQNTMPPDRLSTFIEFKQKTKRLLYLLFVSVWDSHTFWNRKDFSIHISWLYLRQPTTHFHFKIATHNNLVQLLVLWQLVQEHLKSNGTSEKKDEHCWHVLSGH